MTSPPRIVIVGSSFAGYTAALTLAHKLGLKATTPKASITVVSNTERFTLLSSLIWVPFGLRTQDEISFLLRPVLENAGITFICDAALSVNLEARTVRLSSGTLAYDYLLMATGPRANYSNVAGLGPETGNSLSILSFDDALKTGQAWEQLVKNPGPVIIGTTAGATCFGAAYKFVLNMAYQIKLRGLQNKIPITYVTAESELGNFGYEHFDSAAIAARLFTELGIEWRSGKSIDHLEKGIIALSDGERLPYAFAMIIPEFTGVDAIRASPGLGDAKGFIPVDDYYRLPGDARVFAAGIATAVVSSHDTQATWGIPVSEVMARMAAHNIAADISGSAPIFIPFHTLIDRKRASVPLIDAHQFIEPGRLEWQPPSPEAIQAKVAFERSFLAVRKCGWV